MREKTRLTHFYLQIELFTRLVNNSFRIFLPQAHFSGAAWLIACLYSIIQHRHELPGILNVFIVLYAAVLIGVIGSLLDSASKTILISEKVLVPWKRTRNNHAFKRVSRSLQPIRIQCGHFHVITRDRLAFFIRFCLHRTIFLIVRSRTT